LILNKEDTANLLKTIELLRESYNKDQGSLDSSALFDLLKISHGKITSLYENELISLS
jgi:hypothetical protein